MPNKTMAIIMIVVGFLCGILWGILGVVQYSPMVQAIESGDIAEANARYGKIRLFMIIGLVINVVFIAISVLMNMS